ncbi:hypothetical protein [Magnetococcus sp. PR-3]|uniref:hypothetical protein n=1 Tax=Magnetococcus sp. PR-3 TaxID=3120355 RepID=UPI002FCE5FA5
MFSIRKTVTAFMLASTLFALSPNTYASDNAGRYEAIVIQRSVQGKGGHKLAVYGTMMVDTNTGRSWVLDEKIGKWVAVGYKVPGTNMVLEPGKAK